MKLIDSNIYWDIIARMFLEARDMARFETALDNHALRLTYQLPLPPQRQNTRQSPISSIYPTRHTLYNGSSPYESVFDLNDSHPETLISEDMKTWCELRKFRIPNLTLKYSLKSTRYPLRNRLSSGWDLLNYVKVLSVDTPDLATFELIVFRLLNLQSISLRIPSDRDLLALIRYLSTRRTHIISSLTHLSEISLALNIVSSKTLSLLIEALVGIKSVTLIDTKEIVQDVHIESIAHRISSLTSLNLSNCSVSDASLAAFSSSSQAFISITLDYCLYMSIRGIHSLLFNSYASLMELRLRFDDRNKIGLIEDDIIEIITKTASLEHLAIEPLIFSDRILIAIGRSCPGLMHIKLVADNLNIDHGNFSIDGFRALCPGCPYLEYIGIVGYGYTTEIVELLSTSYLCRLRGIYLLAVDSLATLDDFERSLQNSNKRIVASGLLLDKGMAKKFMKVLNIDQEVLLTDYSE
jgi:hypothetical protein